MNPITSKFFPTIRFTASSVAFKLFSASSSSSSSAAITTNAPVIEKNPSPEPAISPRNGVVKARVSKGILEAQLKMDWLESLSCPFPCSKPLDSGWVIGVDPDTSGALALLKPNQPPQVFDSPHLKVLVGKGVRKRLDAKAIVQLLQSFEAPLGTTVYIEQSTPYPQDGRAEALLIAAYGKGIKINSDPPCTVENSDALATGEELVNEFHLLSTPTLNN
uniref:Uncharacterized protein n=1 Tax=Solanum tuberosum TaxID=4113 RepID=M0ZZD7_SOLTU